MRIQMIAFDLDGTLVGHDGKVSERTITALHRAMARGVRIVLATGRPHPSAARVAGQIGLEGPVISSNGGLIRDRMDQVLLHRPLPAAAFAVAWRTVREAGVRAELYAGDRVYLTDPTALDHASRVCQVCAVDEWQGGMPLAEKLFLRSDDPERLAAAEALVRQVLGPDLTFTSSWFDNREVTAADTDKGSGVAWLAGHWGIPLHQVMVVGDSRNDLSMFRRETFGVAMGNAVPELKAVAAAITGSNREDGAAMAVERYVLGEDEEFEAAGA